MTIIQPINLDEAQNNLNVFLDRAHLRHSTSMQLAQKEKCINVCLIGASISLVALAIIFSNPIIASPILFLLPFISRKKVRLVKVIQDNIEQIQLCRKILESSKDCSTNCEKLQKGNLLNQENITSIQNALLKIAETFPCHLEKTELGFKVTSGERVKIEGDFLLSGGFIKKLNTCFSYLNLLKSQIETNANNAQEKLSLQQFSRHINQLQHTIINSAQRIESHTNLLIPLQAI